MTTALTISDQEKLGHLAEEIKSILSQARQLATMQMIAAKYMIGGAISTHELYKKHAKNQSALYESIEEQTSMRPSTLAECVKLYESYPKKDPEMLAEKLFLEHGAWRNIRAMLYGEVVSASGGNIERSNCNRKCPRHCHG